MQRTELPIHDLPSRHQTLRLCVIVTLILVPAVLSLFYIRAYGVNVPFWDEWEVLLLLHELYEGHLSFAQLLAQHNEHRIFFPRLLMLLLASTTRCNSLALMYFDWILLCLSACLIFSVYIRTFGISDWAVSRFIPIAWLLFSLRQHENLLWGFQLSFFMATFFFLATAYLLDLSKKVGWHFFLAATCGIVSSFSVANGLLVWPIGLVQILWFRRWRAEEIKPNYWKMLSLWTLLGAFVYIFYFSGYTKPSYHPSLEYFLYDPTGSLGYFLALIGSPLVPQRHGAILSGGLVVLFVIFALYEVVRKKMLNVRSSVWFALVLFSVFSSIVIVLARAGFGIEQALSSRYTTFTALGVIGSYAIVLHSGLHRSRGRRSWAAVTFSGLMIFGTCVSWYDGIIAGRSTRESRSSAAYYLLTSRFQDDAVLAQYLYPIPRDIRKAIRLAETHRISTFTSLPELPKLSLADSTLFSVDVINKEVLPQHAVIKVRYGDTVYIAGWAVDEREKRVAGGVFIDVDNQLSIPARYGLNRPDVAAHFRNRRYKSSGFFVSFAASVLEKGRHTLSLKVITADRRGYYYPRSIAVLEIE